MKKVTRKVLSFVLCVIFLFVASGGISVFAEEQDTGCEMRAIVCTQHVLMAKRGYAHEQIPGDNVSHIIYWYEWYECANCIYKEVITRGDAIIESHRVEIYQLYDPIIGLYKGYCVECNYLVSAFVEPIPND